MTILTFTLFCLTSVRLCQAVFDDTVCAPPAHTEGFASCSCQTDDGVIDLNPLAHKDGSARFTDVMGSDGYNYSYNPCVPFQYLHPCDNVYVCQSVLDHAGSAAVYVVGSSNEQIRYNNKSQKYYVSYTGTSVRGAQVYLNCDQSTDGNFRFVKQEHGFIPVLYIFELNSCHACPGGCTKHPLPKPDIMCIFVLFILVAFVITSYLVTVTVLVKVRWRAAGSDKVWVHLPLLNKAVEMEVGGTKGGVSDSLERKWRKEVNQTYFGVKYDIPVASASEVYLSYDQKNSGR